MGGDCRETSMAFEGLSGVVKKCHDALLSRAAAGYIGGPAGVAVMAAPAMSAPRKMGRRQ
jgi:hypothetical protein